MALVSKVLGDCPACGRKNGYGNVKVSRDTLLRGCLSCKHLERIPLPALDKKVLYFDQFFYSHAFRGENAAFVNAKDKLQNLAHKQLLVAPYCNIHEDETHLWAPEQRDPLWKFIKQTSAGRHFRPEYEIKARQIESAFRAFLTGDDAAHAIQREDALPSDLNHWDDYMWIDVGRFHAEPAEVRAGKIRSVNELLALFPEWAATPSTFADDLRSELRGGYRSYFRLFADYMQRLIGGDLAAMFRERLNKSPESALVGSDECGATS